MRDELLHYYERELAFIRKMVLEFAQKHPEVAGRLQIDANSAADPHVERLIEAFAVLAARIQLRLDDDFSEISDALLGILYPHYLAPIPSMAIVQLDADPDTTVPPEGLQIDRHTLLYSKPVDGVRCRFRTAYPVTLWPIAVESVELVTANTLGMPVPPEARAALRIRLKTLGESSFADFKIDQLRFFLDARVGVLHQLYELFLRNPIGLTVHAGGRAPRLLGPEAIRPVGFGRDEGLLFYPPESFIGYRVLQEYFAYPEKFMFVELSGFEAGSGSELDLSVLLGESLGELDLRVRPHDLKLGCVPAVNIFEMHLDPIRIAHTAIEYPVTPDIRNLKAYEVYSIQSATSVERGTARTTRFEPIYTARHGAGSGGGSGAYWYAARRSSMRKDDSGTDVFLSLVDDKFNPLTPPSEVLHVDALCTNRDRPARLAFGDPRGDFDLQGQPGVSRVVAVRTPTESLRAPTGRSGRWRIVSHLALNHLSLSGESSASLTAERNGALDALREILKLYDFVDSPITRQRISGLTGLRTRRIVRRVRSGDMSGFARGTEVELLLDPDLYTGTGVFLFASVLESFLGLYASLNSFVETVAHTKLREGILKRWPPRAGELSLL
jgi:type VI secretion system protein ImpG